MSKGTLINIIIIVAIHASLAYFMYTAVEAINIQSTLPVHDYPDNAGTLTSEQINPKATEAYQHFHAMKNIPEAFDSITNPTPRREHRIHGLHQNGHHQARRNVCPSTAGPEPAATHHAKSWPPFTKRWQTN